MKSNFFKIFIFIFLVVFLDKIIGTICKKLYYSSNDNTIYRLCYTLSATKEDILIFGSSRAENHYIPGIINQNTGLRSYNCGFGGEGLIFSLIQLNEVLKRYTPELIVLEVSPNLLNDPESQQKLKILLPFVKRDPLIFNALTNDEMFERVKLLSSIYPYNSTIASLISGRYKRNIDTLNGFRPLHGVLDTVGLTDRINTAISTSSIPPERLRVLKQFISLCNNHSVKLVVVVSPVYQTNLALDELTKKIGVTCSGFKNVHFLDYSKAENFYGQSNYFRDNLHLNYEGAKIFTEVISKKLKELIEPSMNKGVVQQIVKGVKKGYR